MLPLPMTPETFNEQVLTPALALLPAHMDSPAARVLLTAIALQESGLRVRFQELWVKGEDGTPELVKGAARGLLQFERGSKLGGGGVWGVYLHPSTHEPLRLLCRARDCNFDPWPIWADLEFDDVLCAGTGRLLLWTDRRALPEVGAPNFAWECYKRNWRPGKPNPDRWPKNYEAAMKAVLG